MARRDLLLSAEALRRLAQTPNLDQALASLDRANLHLWVSPVSLALAGTPIPQALRQRLTVLPDDPALLLSDAFSEATLLDTYAQRFGIPYVVQPPPECQAPGVSVDDLLNRPDTLSFFQEPVRFLDLRAQMPDVLNGFLSGLQEVLANTAFVQGKQVQAFEEAFAEYLGVRHVVAVNNGTAALILPLMALDLQPGDEIITVSHTFIATAEAVSFVGAQPVFVDVDPRYYTMDPAQIEAKITPRTRGILPVHLYGQPADMDPILEIAEKHGLFVLEDACQAHGALYRSQRAGGWVRAGTLGLAGAFSFYPGKNLGAYGEGGAVATNDDALAQKMRALRDHGSFRKYYHDYIGLNLRINNLQGVVLREKVKHLDRWNDARRHWAQRYRDLLQGVGDLQLPQEAPYARHVYHLFTVLTEHRDNLLEYLKAHGVQVGIHYPIPIHRQKAYAFMGLEEGTLPVSERVARQTLSLPMFAELTEEEVSFVAEQIQNYFRGV